MTAIDIPNPSPRGLLDAVRPDNLGNALTHLADELRRAFPDHAAVGGRFVVAGSHVEATDELTLVVTWTNGPSAAQLAQQLGLTRIGRSSDQLVDHTSPAAHMRVSLNRSVCPEVLAAALVRGLHHIDDADPRLSSHDIADAVEGWFDAQHIPQGELTLWREALRDHPSARNLHRYRWRHRDNVRRQLPASRIQALALAV